MSNLADLLTSDIPLPPHRLADAQEQRLLRQLRLGMVALLPAGERVADRFEVRSILGVGGTAVVYRAADRSRREAEVAVKLLHPGLDEATRHRIEAEARMLEAHRHRNVAVVLDAGVHDGQVFIVTELSERTLPDLMHEGIEVDEALRLFQEVAHGMRFLHGRGVVHRDLKPSSVLLAEAPGALPRARLADCGLGGYLGVGELDVATLFHMPPEQVEDSAPEISHDIYALGVLLFQLLAGQHPTATPEALHSLERRLQRGEPLAFAYRSVLAERRPGELPTSAGLRDVDELQAIVSRAMHPRSTERYASVEALLDDLRRYLAMLPLAGVHQSRRRRALKYLRRNRNKVALVFGLLAVGGVGMGGLSAYQSAPGVVVPVLAEDIPGLEVEVEGLGTWPVAELALQRLGPGYVRLRLRAPDHLPQERVVEVPPGSRVELALDMVHEAGMVRVETDPTRARVTLVDAQGEAVAPAMISPFTYGLATGEWTAMVDADGFLRKERPFQVRHQEVADVAVVLDPWLLARRETGAWAHLSVMPGDPPRISLVSEVMGQPVLELRGGELAEVVARVELPARPSAAALWSDLDQDGVSDAVVSLEDRLILLAGEPLGEVLWEVPFDHEPPTYAPELVKVRGQPALLLAAGSGVQAYGAETGELLWSTTLAQEGSEAPEVLGVVRDSAVVRGKDGSLFGVGLDGQLLWEMPTGVRRATAVLEEDGHLVLGSTDVSGLFVLVQPDQGRVIRESSEESAQVGRLAVWRDQGRWWRVRLEDDGTTTVEDLLEGQGVVDVGTWPGARRAWSLDARGGRLLVVEHAEGLVGARLDESGARPLFDWTSPSVTDLISWRDGSDLRVAWLSGDELVVAAF